MPKDLKNMSVEELTAENKELQAQKIDILDRQRLIADEFVRRQADEKAQTAVGKMTEAEVEAFRNRLKEWEERKSEDGDSESDTGKHAKAGTRRRR